MCKDLVLPSAFKLHEERLSKESLTIIEFQFDRLGLDSTNSKFFYDRFLKISLSPTLPPDDYELVYLTSKIVYMLSNYNHFNNEEFLKKVLLNDGAKIWYSLTLVAKGEIEKAIQLLKRFEQEKIQLADPLVYIEYLSILAQIYFFQGSKNKSELDEILKQLLKFKEENQNTLPNFNQIFMPAYLIINRINSKTLTSMQIIEETNKLCDLAKKTLDDYLVAHFQLDLAQAYLEVNDLESCKQLLSQTFEIFQNIKFKALEAKAIKIEGLFLEKKGEFDKAEKSYLKAKENYGKLEDKVGKSSCVLHLAHLAESLHQEEKAEKLYNETYNISRELNDYYNMINSLLSLSNYFLARGEYNKVFENYQMALELSTNNNLQSLLPSIYDGLTYINFLTGDFSSAVKYCKESLIYKEKFEYDIDNLLLGHIRIGQLTCIIGDFDEAFNEFEKALNQCIKLNRKDDLYFTILNWLFEISTALDNFPLSESYFNRANLFASIHDSIEENAQALISKIRYYIQKQNLDEAEVLLKNIFENEENISSSETIVLALIEKAIILLNKYRLNSDKSLIDEIAQTMENMLFLSLDLEFIPLTIFTKRIFARILVIKNNLKDGLEELSESLELTSDMNMTKFKEELTSDLDNLSTLQKTLSTLSQNEIAAKKDIYLNDVLALLRLIFWIVSASKYQK